MCRAGVCCETSVCKVLGKIYGLSESILQHLLGRFVECLMIVCDR